MKTISDMQLMIKAAYANLDELSKNLSEYGQAEDKEVTIDFEKLKIIGSRNPLSGHILAKADSLTKKQYVTLLVALIYLADENQEKGWLFIQRLALGVDLKEELAELAVSALNLMDSQIDDFTNAVSASGCKEALLLDCMLVYLSCEHEDKNMLEFIALLGELLNCGEMAVRELSDLARAIAAQDAEAYFGRCMEFQHIGLVGSLYYFLPTKAEIVDNLEAAAKSRNSHVIIFHAVICNLDKCILLDDFSPDTIEFLYCRFESSWGVQSKKKNVVFDRTEFVQMKAFKTEKRSFIVETNHCRITSCNFRDCNITQSLLSIESGNIENSVFINCTAKKMPTESTLIELRDGSIDKCEFLSCEINTDQENRCMTVAGILKLERGKITDCKFSNCQSYVNSSYGRYSHYKSYIIYLVDSSVRECEFLNCNCKGSFDSADIYDNYIIAMQQSSQSNNLFTKCRSNQRAYSTESDSLIGVLS